jgi:putative transposase
VIELVLEERSRSDVRGVKKIYDKRKADIHRINPGLGRDKLFVLVAKHGLLCKRKRRYAVTTQSKHRFNTFSNQMKGYTPTRPHQAWVGDITYLRTREGFVYLFLLTDAYSRKIVGWNLTKSPDVRSGLRAARMAIKQCPDTKGLIHHTDHGIQYCSPRYVKKLQLRGITMSMGEKGNCYENAMAERVNGILKIEYGLYATFLNFSEALKVVKESIKDYNEQRPHWGLNLKIPAVVHAENIAA